MDENFNINPDIVDQVAATPALEPFADGWAGSAYVNDASKLNLNKLLHLAPYSEVLLVSGPEGVGKSTLLQQFVISAKKSWKVVHLRASSLMTIEEFLRQIVHGFGLASAAADDIEEMLIEIGRHLQALGRSGRRAIVVIDDLQLLPDEVVVMVEHILSDERSAHAISLVLSVDDGAAASRLDSFPVLLHRLAYTLRLEPMAEAEVAGYIRHRLAHSSNQAAESLFSAALIRQIYNKSGGLPGKVNELARRHLNKKSGSKGGVASGNGRNLVRVGLVLLGVAAVGAVLLFQDRINRLVVTAPKSPKVVTRELAAPVVKEAAIGTEEKGVVPEVAATGAIASGAGVAAETVAPALSMGELGDQPESRLATAPKPVPAAAEVSQAQTKAESSGAAAIAVKPQPEESPVAPKSSALASVPKQASTDRSRAESVATAAPVKAVANSSGKAPAKRVERAAAQEWLQSQDPQHFTLQFMALRDEAEVRQFVKKHKLEGESGIFYITRKGDRLTALVYGSYPDRAAADEASRSLPKEWGVKGAWVRTFATVFDDMKSN